MSHRHISLSGTNPFDRSYTIEQKCYDESIIRMLSYVMNTSMQYIRTPLITNLVSYERNPNSWVVEQLVRGVADISSSTLVLTPDSNQSVDYSIAVGSFRPQMYNKAQSIRNASNIYFIPFDVDTWVALLCLLLVITAVLTFTLARESRLPHDTPYDLIARIADEKHDAGIDWNAIDMKATSAETLRKREHWDIGEIILVTIGAICQQGSERDPSTAAARTLLLALFVLAVLVYTAFSASVISLISLLPNTEEEVHNGRLPPNSTQILLHDTNFFRYSIHIPPREVILTPLQDGLMKALKGEGAFIADRDTSLTALHKLRLPPDLRCGVRRTFFGLDYQRVFAFRSNSPYRAEINNNILRFRQYGLLAREKKKYFNSRRPCSVKERLTLSGFVSVDLSDIQPALYLLFWGWTVALLAMVFEYLVFYCSFEVRKNFGKSWTSKENSAAIVLQQWLRLKRLGGNRDDNKFRTTRAQRKTDPHSRSHTQFY